MSRGVAERAGVPAERCVLGRTIARLTSQVSASAREQRRPEQHDVSSEFLAHAFCGASLQRDRDASFAMFERAGATRRTRDDAWHAAAFCT
jgi:hypothetical protein